MSIKVCSDVNIRKCCGGGLSKGSGEEFSKNHVENWDVDEIGGNCRNEEFEVRSNFRVFYDFPLKFAFALYYILSNTFRY